ncbi:MAG: ABC transporter permease [Chitinispirillaceae bacterium]|nr:ABC transporter permease [Chitinispirillaceae bacterium]
MIAPLRLVALTGQSAIRLTRSSGLFLRSLARFSSLISRTASRSHLSIKNPELTLAQMYSLGVESLPLVTVIALFLGMEVVVQAIYQMAGIIPMRYLGVLVCKSITTELGPVITSMVVAGRVATGIAAEIGSMKTSEQLDAMQVLRLDPIRYLIVPKTLACIIMLPILVIWAEFTAICGALLAVLLTVDMSMHSFFSGLRLFFNPNDLFIGVLKTAVFGAIIAFTGAHFGFESKSGAEGVGNATTKAVITAIVLVLIFDFLIAFLVL